MNRVCKQRGPVHGNDAAAKPDQATLAAPPRFERNKSRLIPIVVFIIVSLGCSAADLVQRQRETSTPETESTVALIPTFTATPVPQQTVLIVTPPTDGQPGVIIVPPGTDPESVLPAVPTATAVSDTPTAIVLVPVESPTPDGVVLTATPDSTPQPGETPTGTPLLVPTETPLPLTATPTQTGTPTPTGTATPPPTPYAIVGSGLVTLRTGPGVEYPLIAQLGANIPVAIISQSPDGTWAEVCCLSGEPAWVAVQHVQVINDIAFVPPAEAGPVPTATPTDTPTITPTVTPTPTATPYPFEKAIGPQFFPTGNEFLTIWVKLFVGVEPDEEAAPGYTVSVFFEGFPRPNASSMQTSVDFFDFSAPPGSGNRIEYNFKYEYYPPDPKSLDPNSEATPLQLLGTGTWTVYVSDGSGMQLSEPVTFTTAPSNPNREVYIGWVRVR